MKNILKNIIDLFWINTMDYSITTSMCLECGTEEPKESFEERTAKKLDNDILDKISYEAKQETIAKVREMIEETFENFNLHDWSGEQEVYNEINRLKGKVSDKLNGI